RLARCELGAVALFLSCCSGCSVLVQNRYSVFGFDGLQTHSADQAKVWSLAILGGVALVAGAIGAILFAVGVRWHHRRKHRAEDGRYPQSTLIRDPLAVAGVQDLVKYG